MLLSASLFRSLTSVRGLALLKSSPSTKSCRFSSLAIDMSTLYDERFFDHGRDLQETKRSNATPQIPIQTTATPVPPTVPDVEDLHIQALQQQQTSYVDPTTGFTVFTELLHLKRGTCCGNQCRHCPYGFENVPQKVKNSMLNSSVPLPVAKCRSGDKARTQELVRAIQDGNFDLFLNSSIANLSDGNSATTNPNSTSSKTVKTAIIMATTPTTSKNVPYTRKGDTGTSQLGTGERRPKCDCNFEALGTVDELCSIVGVAHASLSPKQYEYGPLPERLLDVMSRLFDLGSHVAKPRIQQVARNDNDDSDGSVTFKPNGIGDGFDADHIDDLESWINEMTEELPELTSFILPTGAMGAAQLHVARTVCRRAERRLVPLVVDEATCDPNALRYLNRLSDFFFVAARWVNFCEGHEEIEYRRETAETKQRERVHRSLN
ncbi:cobalamin adenosyltransferase [Nitzschia inconspicua]|uniref:Corrinoid adenosyltransferase MMAB n=1 Tax=Nitzschia inconspicua TaxID=303405 RepID=A0A9K3KPE4_9STRA|nr:cobalamin adenosyltransferase [Nitzschia inconspicua]KAG7347543.1 cobalamin adenosyltransferase [Nitzschia inconspicua]